MTKNWQIGDKMNCTLFKVELSFLEVEIVLFLEVTNVFFLEVTIVFFLEVAIIIFKKWQLSFF